MVNKRLLIIGAVVALLFGGALFFLATTDGSKPPVEILAARQELTAGTRISHLPDDTFARIPLTGDQTVLGSYLTEPTWRKMQAAGGILVRDIYEYEAVPLSSIASTANPRTVDIPRLGLTDPDLVVVTLTNVEVPSGIKAGDYVDLIVSVEGRQEQLLPFTQPLDPIDKEIGVDGAAVPIAPEEGEATSTPLPTATASPTPTLTPTPTLVPAYPLAKVIVRSAEVAAVQREQNISSSGDGLILGAISGIDVIIPREAQELVMMSDTAGQLGVSLLSPMVDADHDKGPTLGAHFEDLIEIFTADRNALSEADTEQ